MAKVVLRVIGVVNVVLTILGIFWLVHSVYDVLLRYRPDSEFPYFGSAFVVMTIINMIFLAFFVFIGFQLLRVRQSAIAVHSIASAALVAYGLLNGGLWLSGRGIGASIAAASGIGNMGIAPFTVLFLVPYLYPIISTIVLQAARIKMKATLGPKPSTP